MVRHGVSIPNSSKSTRKKSSGSRRGIEDEGRRHLRIELREQRVEQRRLAGADLAGEHDEALPRAHRVDQHREALAVRLAEAPGTTDRASSRRARASARRIRGTRVSPRSSAPPPRRAPSRVTRFSRRAAQEPGQAVHPQVVRGAADQREDDEPERGERRAQALAAQDHPIPFEPDLRESSRAPAARSATGAGARRAAIGRSPRAAAPGPRRRRSRTACRAR